MKKEKFLSLILLFILSGSYLAPGVTLAETVGRLARRPRQEQGKFRDHESNEVSTSEDGKESENEEARSESGESAEASSQGASAGSSSQDKQEQKPSNSQANQEEKRADSKTSQDSSSSSQGEASLEQPSDGQPDSRQGADHQTEQTNSSSSTGSSSGTGFGSDQDQQTESKQVDHNQAKQLEKSESKAKAKSGQPAGKSKSIPAHQQNQASFGQADILVSPFFDGYRMSQPNATYLSDDDKNSKGPLTYTTYVEHWSGSDAYSHNLLSHRYGIKAEQLDGYLQSLGIAYDQRRINGQLLLKWEKETGLDVRAIIAIALHESSLGTAGVATLPGSNMFGYGAFDSNPNNASHFSDDQAIHKMVAQTLIQNKNWTFKIQDDKAAKNATGQLNVLLDGGVYFTDTSGSGKRRAQTMQDIDTWIDQHGDTPKIPEKLKHLTGNSQVNLPAGYRLSCPINPKTYLANSYPWGQCTWYVYNRAYELGYNFDPYMGNGGDWQFKSGYDLSHQPKVGYAISFAPGQAGADPDYGHVAIVEQVKKDGSILISESNALGSGVVSYRTFTADQAAELTYVIGKRS